MLLPIVLLGRMTIEFRSLRCVLRIDVSGMSVELRLLRCVLIIERARLAGSRIAMLATLYRVLKNCD